MPSKDPVLMLMYVVLGLGMLILISLGATQDVAERDVSRSSHSASPIGVNGYWQGGLGIQLGGNDDSRLILGLDLSLMQTESPGDISGRMALATPTMYLSFNITQGKEESSTVTFEAVGPASFLPGASILTFQFTGTESTNGELQGNGTYSVSDKTYDFTWRAKRSKSEGMRIRGP